MFSCVKQGHISVYNSLQYMLLEWIRHDAKFVDILCCLFYLFIYFLHWVIPKYKNLYTHHPLIQIQFNWFYSIDSLLQNSACRASVGVLSHLSNSWFRKGPQTSLHIYTYSAIGSMADWNILSQILIGISIWIDFFDSIDKKALLAWVFITQSRVYRRRLCRISHVCS